MPFPPQAFLIGAQKCATTSIAAILDSHPDVCLATGKEPNFFDHNWEKGLNWYRGKFPNIDAPILLDASVSYTQADNSVDGSPDVDDAVPQRIRIVNPYARFIYVVREPVARTYSAYWHAVRNGRETRLFSEVLCSHNNYEDTSDYAAQLRAYLAHFASEQVLVVTYESFARAPRETIDQMVSFLGLDERAIPPDATRVFVNKSYELTRIGRMIHALFPSNDSFKASMLFTRRLVPPVLRDRAADLMRKEFPPIGEEEARMLRERFVPKIAALSKLTGLDLSDWTDSRSSRAR